MTKIMLTFNTRDVYVENFVETVENPAAAPFLRILGIHGRNFFRLFPSQKGIKQIICRLRRPLRGRTCSPRSGGCLRRAYFFCTKEIGERTCLRAAALRNPVEGP